MGVHFKENEEKFTFGMIITGIVIIAILLTTLIIYLLNINNMDSIVKEEQIAAKQEIPEDDEEFEEVSIEMGKTVNEASDELNKAIDDVNEELKQNKQNQDSNSSNLANTVNTTANVKKEEKKDNTVKEEKKQVKESEQSKKELSFIAPIKGEIIREFAPDSLVYSETLEEWITHNGIDIKADKTSVVVAAEEGTVSAIKTDPRYGLTVIIDHEDGYQTVYANLLTAEFVVQGEKVEKGQTIGTIGNTANFEIADPYHLHFEIQKDGDYVNPINFIEL